MPITEDRREKFNEMIDFFDLVDCEIVNYALDFTGTVLSDYCNEIQGKIIESAKNKENILKVNNIEMITKLKEFALKEIARIDKVIEKAKKRMN